MIYKDRYKKVLTNATPCSFDFFTEYVYFKCPLNLNLYSVICSLHYYPPVHSLVMLFTKVVEIVEYSKHCSVYCCGGNSKV